MEAFDEVGRVKLTQRNKFSVNETIEVMQKDGSNAFYQVAEILDEEGKTMQSAPHPKQEIYVKLLPLDEEHKGLEEGLVLRRKE